MIRPEIICEAYDAGINFFFVTADMHWPLYEETRRGIAALLERPGVRRDDIVVAGVSYVTQPEFSSAPMRELVAAIPGLERLDVSVAGGCYDDNLLARISRYAGHAREPSIGSRATGASFHDRGTALTAINHALVDIAFVRYNAAHPGAAEDVFPFLDGDSKTLRYCFKSQGGRVAERRLRELGVSEDKWRPRPADHYRFVLSRSEFDGILCAFEAASEVRQLADALDEGGLTDAECAYLLTLAELDAGDAELAP